MLNIGYNPLLDEEARTIVDMLAHTFTYVGDIAEYSSLPKLLSVVTKGTVLNPIPKELKTALSARRSRYGSLHGHSRLVSDLLAVGAVAESAVVTLA